VGQGRLTLELPVEATVGDLAGEMARRYPVLTEQPEGLVVAVNDEYQDHLFRLNDGDEIALIPPVSGGAAARFSKLEYVPPSEMPSVAPPLEKGVRGDFPHPDHVTQQAL
jgi:molybdopterin converting factor small subunit